MQSYVESKMCCMCTQGHVESKMKLEDVDEKGNVMLPAAGDLKPAAGKLFLFFKEFVFADKNGVFRLE